MARVRILTAHSLGGGRDVFPGDVIELDDRAAEQKVSNGWAAYVSPDTKEYFVNRQEQLTTREPKSESRDPGDAQGGHGRNPNDGRGRQGSGLTTDDVSGSESGGRGGRGRRGGSGDAEGGHDGDDAPAGRGGRGGSTGDGGNQTKQN